MFIGCGHNCDNIPDAMLAHSSIIQPFQFLTEDESRILASYGPPGTSPPLAWRDGLVVRIFLATGLRRFELQALQPESFRHHLNALWIVVTGKGSRVRWIPFPEHLHQEILDLQKALSTNVIIPAWPITCPTKISAAAYNTIARSVSRAGRHSLGRHIHCHLLRHTAASLMLSTGAPLQGVQAILGHVHTSTTSRYIHAHPRMLLHAASPAFYEAIGVHPTQTLIRFPIERRKTN